MKSLKNLMAFVAFALAFALGVPTSAQAQQTAVVFALDGSGTSNASDRNAICKPSIDKAIAELNVGDSIMVYAVDDKKMSEKLPLYEGTFEAKSGNRLQVKVGRDRLVGGVRAAVDAWMGMSAKTSRYGDGFLFAADYLSKKPAAVKRLYVCGDGVEEGPALNISKSVPKDAMARFVRAGLVPASTFAGTEISWVGLGGGIEAVHMTLIKEFWTDYFAKTGAKVITMQRLGL